MLYMSEGVMCAAGAAGVGAAGAGAGAAASTSTTATASPLLLLRSRARSSSHVSMPATRNPPWLLLGASSRSTNYTRRRVATWGPSKNMSEETTTLISTGCRGHGTSSREHDTNTSAAGWTTFYALVFSSD